MFRGLLLAGCFFSIAFNIYCEEENTLSNCKDRDTAVQILQILKEQPDSVEGCGKNRIYINPERVRISKNGACVRNNNSCVKISRFGVDEMGVFLPCTVANLKEESANLKEESKENENASQHSENAVSALVEAVVHAMTAGVLIEIPPLALYEVYEASKNFIEAAKEYNEYSRLNGYDWQGGNDNSSGSNYSDPPAKTRIRAHNVRANN